MLHRILRRYGHRASALAGFGMVACAYGTGLALGYHPTFTVAYRLPTEAFGWAWIGVGVFSFTGLVSRGHDALHFAVGELAACAWCLLLATHWISPYGWTAGISWAGIAAAMLLGSTWADAPKLVRPELPTVEELTKPDLPT